MAQENSPTNRTLFFRDSFLNAARNLLSRCNLITSVQIVRAWIHFGPWRVIPQVIIRCLRPIDQSSERNQDPLLVSLNAGLVAREIHENSVALAGKLPSEFVNRLRTLTDRLPVDEYQLMHLIDKDVRRLSEDPAIKSVLRTYFKCEPVLLESSFFITGSHAIHGLGGQNSFHFDFAGWQSVNVFVYLTDVTEESSYHIVVKGSHRDIGFRDALRSSLTETEAKRRFGNSIKPIFGPAGTVFFENTEAFHRRYPGNERRVILNMLFASHRSFLSYGRTSREHMKKREQACEEVFTI